jgi:hypothetical protein
MKPLFSTTDQAGDACSPRSMVAEEALMSFVACAHTMLDPMTPEAQRRAVEPRLLAQLPTLRALGVFELFDIRHEALRRLVDDELETMPHVDNPRSYVLG